MRVFIADVVGQVAVFVQGNRQLAGIVADELQQLQHDRRLPVARLRLTRRPAECRPSVTVAQRQLRRAQRELRQPLRTSLIEFIHRLEPD